ncbi:Sarcolemmal membrane-associated protein [Chelonia mydas]|uniref:Sarcolemmal membrane-associated protein n=1 Tax=Chelonia mydas TaxID=8469 RepID=M7BEN0_CHEMY|nr:Sarcolemmal membrane-associated protein [Chelonia mydas]
MLAKDSARAESQRLVSISTIKTNSVKSSGECTKEMCSKYGKIFYLGRYFSDEYTSVIHAPLPSPVDKVAANTPSMYSQELFQLSQYLQEALHREQMLEQKLATLQRLLAVTQEASDTSWQRSLSNTEDECTHLKEMNERTQEELRELANKYNGAVNEIKDLSDKLKVAEGRQEEIQQKGQAEKKELQHKINEMEEREQELQAKIEALQADNDFTNERLTALQVRLEHLQEKTLKEHNSLGIQVDDFIPKINGSAEKENQARAKESDLSDTLSPSKEKSSDDTTDAQMDEQELNEPIAKVSLLKDELQGAQSETETKQEIQQLHKELIEAQELARTSKQKCFELQAQLHRLQEDIENLREEKENEISSARNELLRAQDEILLLQQGAEKAASERETDIAALQEELQEVRAELERWRKEASEYEKEIVSLQASFQLRCQQCEDQQREEATRLQGHMKHYFFDYFTQSNFTLFTGELEKLRKEWSDLEAVCLSLKNENTLLASELQRQEKELHSSQKQSLALTGDLSVLEMTRKELENQVGSLKEQHQRDAASLKTLLSQAENQAKDVQKEYEKTQTVLSELKLKFEMTEQEKQSITDELKQCKDNLKLLQEKGNNVSLYKLCVGLCDGKSCVDFDNI